MRSKDGGRERTEVRALEASRAPSDVIRSATTWNPTMRTRNRKNPSQGASKPIDVSASDAVCSRRHPGLAGQMVFEQGKTPYAEVRLVKSLDLSR